MKPPAHFSVFPAAVVASPDAATPVGSPFPPAPGGHRLGRIADWRSRGRRWLREWLAVALAGLGTGLGVLTHGGDALEAGFAAPPASTRPWCYWYWISDHLSREGITRDLESMARVGIGEAFIGNIFLDDIPAGKVKVLSPEWWGLVEHAIREGGRVGVDIGLFNSPGWSQSGGPWVRPEDAMRHLVSSEIRVQGPSRFGRQLARPAPVFQDVAVLAFRSPSGDAAGLKLAGARLDCRPAGPGLEALTDGREETVFAFPAGAGQGKDRFTIWLELPQPFTARSLTLTPGETAWAAQVELRAAGSDGEFRVVEAFGFDRSNHAIGVGPQPRGPVVRSFEPVTARRFEVMFTGVSGRAALAGLELSPGARVEAVVEKQLGKMHPTPLPLWDAYLWPTNAGPDEPSLAVLPGEVVDLSGRMRADGLLDWEVPSGEWVILRTGMTPTGTRNAPASPEGQGLEIDKMSRPAARRHFEAFIGEVLRRMPPADRRAFRRVVADSYEMGSQNWTDDLGPTFRARYGYDPLPWLPVLTGRVVGSAEQSDRFLWDLRRLVADRVARDYVGGLRDLCRPHGLELWLENYGHWGFPAEFLQYGGQSDRIGGEFWVTGDLGSIELRAASSCANTYGRPVVSAEAFTGGPAFQTVPAGLKARGDWAFCEGVNHFVLHVAIHQPWEDRVPGVNAWFGTEFNRHNTWFEPGRAWVDYLRRCSFLLQQGWRVADVAYFIGEDAPKMTGVRQPPLPAGYDFDYVNAEVLLGDVKVRDGQLTLPHGTRYRVLVLPELDTMRPTVLRRLRDLVRAGATVLGPPPGRSPSLEDYPRCDHEVRRLADELWGAASTATEPAVRRDRRFGKGRVLTGGELVGVLHASGAGPDFQSEPKLRYTHRRDGAVDLYFVANPSPQPVQAHAAFRVGARAPEFWWPDTGRIERPAVYQIVDGQVRLPIPLGPHGSVFVVFREAAAANPVVAVRKDGGRVTDARWTPSADEAAPGPRGTVADTFTVAAWVLPAADTTLLEERNAGVSGLGDPRNDVVFPPHGDGFGGAGHAGSGFAVGRNGVVVFEHGANYFAPVLVHAVVLTHWTHVAIAYQDGQPTLYLNGIRARQGLRSGHTVHPGTAGGPAPFRGELGPVEQIPGNPGDAALAVLPAGMPRPGAAGEGPILALQRAADGGWVGEAWQAGNYEVEYADGRKQAIEVGAVPVWVELAGPWELAFTPGWGAPERITFPSLKDWTRHADAGIRHYSGRVVYRKTFGWTAAAAGAEAGSTWLDLGQVRDLATVRLNGHACGTLWLAPWRVDVTDALQPGRNELEIEVVNPWNNRLVGDAALPAAQRRTWLATPTVGKDAPLLPAGLLGPVRLIEGRRVPVTAAPATPAPTVSAGGGAR